MPGGSHHDLTRVTPGDLRTGESLCPRRGEFRAEAALRRRSAFLPLCEGGLRFSLFSAPRLQLLPEVLQRSGRGSFSLPGGCSAGELGLERTQRLAMPPRVASEVASMKRSLKKMCRPEENKEPQGVLYEIVPDDTDDCKESLEVPWALGGRDG
ncbi:hypothetical protein P7K49_027080 [Saguinus oedipus]|uniref:Uncharacterized protein n=1 Tax=Saguinus oedipus TaxID=9490 RepID=A0ABQ9UFU3_SAGOE|nr:hypothetical protein P7K49_027080 [Saguinus oedipus]